ARAGGSETRLLVLLMVSVAGLGSMMSSTAVVAIFIPVVMRICKNTGTAPGKLMMPMSAAALVSGMLTLVATAPNLVVNAELVRQGFEGFNFFSVTVFGLPVLALAVGYMLLTRGWLPATIRESTSQRRRPTFREFAEKYQLGGREHRVRVRPDSPLAGKRLDEVELRATGINLIALERPGRRRLDIVRPDARTELRAGDILLLDVRSSDVETAKLKDQYGVDTLILSGAGVYFSDRAQDLGMVEAIIPAESRLLGLTVLQARMRTGSGLTVIGLRRGQAVIAEHLLEEKLEVGDTLLLTGFWKDIRRFQQQSHDVVMLDMPAELDEILPAADKAPQALAVLALVVALMVFEVVPNVHAVLLGCLLLGLLRCVDMASAYRSINWPSLVLIVGMMPFSLALQRTGGV
ncbi:MAG: SLC13 family permease, partial [Geminicoccaceae bacterium]|nr:SLC13 family permease [Geminicoccaceae bacterium]